MTFKPKCDDFVIAAIETLRRRPDNINPPDAWSGVLLQRLYKVASPVYTATEVVGAVQRLLKKQVLLGICEGDVGTGFRELEGLFPKTNTLLQAGHRCWYFDSKGVVVVPEVRGSGACRLVIRFPNLYLRRDKIPNRLLHSITGKEKFGPGKKQKSHRKTKAELIIESMRQS